MQVLQVRQSQSAKTWIWSFGISKFNLNRPWNQQIVAVGHAPRFPDDFWWVLSIPKNFSRIFWKFSKSKSIKKHTDEKDFLVLMMTTTIHSNKKLCYDFEFVCYGQRLIILRKIRVEGDSVELTSWLKWSFSI